jgi:hypothetical protein
MGGILVNFIGAIVIFTMLLWQYGTDTLPLRNVNTGLYYSQVLLDEGFEQQDKILTIDGTDIYITGDTDITSECSSISCDILMLPVGGFGRELSLIEIDVVPIGESLGMDAGAHGFRLAVCMEPDLGEVPAEARFHHMLQPGRHLPADALQAGELSLHPGGDSDPGGSGYPSRDLAMDHAGMDDIIGHGVGLLLLLVLGRGRFKFGMHQRPGREGLPRHRVLSGFVPDMGGLGFKLEGGIHNGGNNNYPEI